MRLNRLPASTFNRLGMNESRVDYEAGAPENYEIYSDTRLDFTKGGDVSVAITVPDGKSIVVVMSCDFDDTLSIETTVDIGKDGVLRLIQVYAAASDARLINRVRVSAVDNARLEAVQIYPGCGKTYSDLTADLKGNESSADIRYAYLAGRDERLDINCVVNHIGKQSESIIYANGALQDNAFKLFRGTIDFRTGSSLSRGDEREKVLLLGDDVINQSIPLILCTEEEVEGAHGAAIGSLDEETLLYMESRGLSEGEAKKLVIYGMFNSLLTLTQDEKVSEQVNKCLERKQI